MRFVETPVSASLKERRASFALARGAAAVGMAACHALFPHIPDGARAGFRLNNNMQQPCKHLYDSIADKWLQ